MKHKITILVSIILLLLVVAFIYQEMASGNSKKITKVAILISSDKYKDDGVIIYDTNIAHKGCINISIKDSNVWDHFFIDGGLEKIYEGKCNPTK